MCGIFGFNGKEGCKANIYKLKLLAAYNAERGTDSCGYYFNGHIDKGVDKISDIRDFMAVNRFERGDLNCEVFLGHTRYSTVGGNSYYNAHPHQTHDFVQTHNGTIQNIKELAKKYEILDGYQVDSRALAEIIDREGFEVLKEYVGFAALAMTWKTDPTALYLYHGASRNIKDGELFIERPLFILYQPEGMYYSSLQESLNAISEDDNRALKLKHNYVYRIRNGDFDDFSFPVEREDMNIKFEVKKNIPKDSHLDKNTTDAIRYDSVSLAVTNDRTRVYYKYGRYYNNYILLNGIYSLFKDGTIKNDFSQETAELYYFIKGVMMKNKNAYDKALLKLPKKDAENIALVLSPFSKYPVFCLHNEGTWALEHFRNRWWFDHKIVKELTFMPQFSTNMYSIKDGKTKEIRSITPILLGA